MAGTIATWLRFWWSGWSIGRLAGYLTRPESAEIKLGPLNIEVRGDQVAHDSGPLTCSQVQHIAMITLIGGVIGLGSALRPAEAKAEWHGNFISNWCRRKSCCSPARSSRSTCRAPRAISACSPATRRWSTTLRPGILTVYAGGGAQKIVVLGGFAEVSAKGLTVLADVAEAVEDIDRAHDRRRASAKWRADREDRAGLRARQADHAARSFQGQSTGTSPARRCTEASVHRRR